MTFMPSKRLLPGDWELDDTMKGTRLAEQPTLITLEDDERCGKSGFNTVIYSEHLGARQLDLSSNMHNQHRNTQNALTENGSLGTSLRLIA